MRSTFRKTALVLAITAATFATFGELAHAYAATMHNEVPSVGQPVSPSQIDPAQCPPIYACPATGCLDGVLPPDPVRALHVAGVELPHTTTNVPLLNAGLYFLHRYNSDQFLVDALTLLCRAPRNTPGVSPIACDNDAAAGQMRGTTPDFDVFDVWAAVGYVADGNVKSRGERAREACKRYQDIDQTVATRLAPEVGLQGSPLTEEGIRIRVGLMRAFFARPTLDARCKQNMAALSANARNGDGALAAIADRVCSSTSAYFDDIRFAYLLADKLAVDGKAASLWGLLRAVDRSAIQLSLLTGLSVRNAAERQIYLEGLNRLLTADATALRQAIQRAL